MLFFVRPPYSAAVAALLLQHHCFTAVAVAPSSASVERKGDDGDEIETGRPTLVRTPPKTAVYEKYTKEQSSVPLLGELYAEKLLFSFSLSFDDSVCSIVSAPEEALLV